MRRNFKKKSIKELLRELKHHQNVINKYNDDLADVLLDENYLKMSSYDKTKYLEVFKKCYSYQEHLNKVNELKEELPFYNFIIKCNKFFDNNLVNKKVRSI